VGSAFTFEVRFKVLAAGMDGLKLELPESNSEPNLEPRNPELTLNP
jgi:hypothetical protein